MNRPPGGWSDLVTNQTLDAKFQVLDASFDSVSARFDVIDARIDRLRADVSAMVDRRLRAQTWITTTTLIAA